MILFFALYIWRKSLRICPAIIPLALLNFKVIKKFTVNNEGFNQTILEVHPDKLDMTRFLMKGELTRCEFFKKRIKELGLSTADILEKGFDFRDEIMNEYKEIVQS